MLIINVLYKLFILLRKIIQKFEVSEIFVFFLKLVSQCKASFIWSKIQ